MSKQTDERAELIAWLNHSADQAEMYAITSRDARRYRRAAAMLAADKPVDMVLYCPKCGVQHIDAPDERTPDWSNPPHKSHLCHGCGHICRPSDTPTNGVARTASGKDADTAPLLAADKAGGEAVKFLCNGTRFKMAFFDDGDDEDYGGTIHVKCFNNFEKELDGRWVALVAAEDDAHLQYTHHQPQDMPDDVVKDAERYRWLRENGLPSIPFGDLNATIDAAMLKEGK